MSEMFTVRRITCGSVLVVGMALAVIAGSIREAAAQMVWDLAADWSDAQNPNGVWSYNGSPGTPIALHQSPDWDSTDCCYTQDQPAWALDVAPNNDHIPFWLKVVSPVTFFTPGVEGFDEPIGTVVTHPKGAGVPSSVTWASPIDGFIDISGGVWVAQLHDSRSSNWILSINGSPLTSETVTALDGNTSASPFPLSNGSGGSVGITDVEVEIGDVITLSFEPPANTPPVATGVILTIAEAIIPVAIDIKPGSDPNSINLSSGGATPVAILGSADLDGSVEDVSGDFSGGPEGAPDGFDDLVCHFETISIAPEEGETLAKLSGELSTPGRQKIEGTDSVNIVP
jgi:hypothetical protein